MTDRQTSPEITLRYFAWLRERSGVSVERIVLPADVLTIKDLLLWQSRRGPPFESAFAKPEAVRVAIDQAHVKPGTPIGNAREIAFFPPVTGG
jgi:sulfur-carrier protein